MNTLPTNPHAIVEITRPGYSDGQGQIIYDSWENPRLFKSVNVELSTNQSAEGRIEFFDPNFTLIDTFSGEDAIPMATVRIFLGYGQNLGEPVFKGLLAQIERGESSTSFIAYDMGFQMKLIKKAGYKNKKDDLAIIKALVERNKLKFEGPEKPLKLEPHRAMAQDEQTDWEHALERAHDAGLVVFVRQDTFFAKYPAKVGTPVLTLKNKQDFILRRDWDFIHRTPENQDGRPKQVLHRGRGKGGKRVEGTSDVSQRGRESVVLKRDISGKATKTKLSKRAQAQKELEREHAFEGRISTTFPINGERLDVRNTVKIEGIGKLFSGNYICNSVDYNFAPGTLGLNLELYRDIKG